MMLQAILSDNCATSVLPKALQQKLAQLPLREYLMKCVGFQFSGKGKGFHPFQSWSVWPVFGIQVLIVLIDLNWASVQTLISSLCLSNCEVAFCYKMLHAVGGYATIGSFAFICCAYQHQQGVSTSGSYLEGPWCPQHLV